MRLIAKISIALACLSLLSACQNGGAEFRRVLRSAARETAKTGDNDKKTTSKKISSTGIKSCPEGSKLLGSIGTTQWCSVPTKDGKGAKHGEYRKWHDNGKTKISCTYDHGKAQGRYIEWHSNGQKKVEGNYIENEKNGRWIEWNAEGAKLSERSFKLGIPHGKFVLFSKKGSIESEGFYNEGNKSGLWITYNSKGQPKSKITYQAGKKHGPAEIYGRNSLVKQLENYYADIPHGQWITYWPSGAKKLEGNYDKGQKVGAWTSYSKDGNPKESNIFKDGTATRISATETKKRRTKKLKHKRFGKGNILGVEPSRNYSSQQQAVQSESNSPSNLSTGQNWQNF